MDTLYYLKEHLIKNMIL